MRLTPTRETKNHVIFKVIGTREIGKTCPSITNRSGEREAVAEVHLINQMTTIDLTSTARIRLDREMEAMEEDLVTSIPNIPTPRGLNIGITGTNRGIRGITIRQDTGHDGRPIPPPQAEVNAHVDTCPTAEADLGDTTRLPHVGLPHKRTGGIQAMAQATTKVNPQKEIIFLEISTHSNSPRH